MTTTNQFDKSDMLYFPAKTTGENRAKTDKKSTSSPANINPSLAPERLSGVRHCVVEGLFGKRHWATDWVVSLCEADSRFLFHLADQSRGYVHFICLVRLALLQRSTEMRDVKECAHWICSQSKKKILQHLYPACPTGILGVLPKLQKKPLSKDEYRLLFRALSDKDMCKRFNHVRHIRKFDIHLLEILDNAPKELQFSGFINYIKKHSDYKYFLCLAKIIRHLNIEVTQREINAASKNMNKMSQLSDLFNKKIKHSPFPPPPWEGNDFVKPVCSREQLKEVRRNFNNCVMDYIPKIVLGYSYFYICESMPAVIEMVKDAGVGWEIGSMECPREQPPRRRRRHNDDYLLSDAYTDQIIKVFSDAGFDLRPDDLDKHDMNYADVVVYGSDFFST